MGDFVSKCLHASLPAAGRVNSVFSPPPRHQVTLSANPISSLFTYSQVVRSDPVIRQLVLLALGSEQDKYHDLPHSILKNKLNF